jgi:hypothetical protein
MKFVMQTQFFSKAEGTHGNCQQAVIASMLDLDIDEVPNFIEQDYFWHSVKQFLASKGLQQESVFRELHDTIEGPYLVYGPSSRGILHAVIYQNGKLLHDPHPSGEGVLEIKTVERLVPLEESDGIDRNY